MIQLLSYELCSTMNYVVRMYWYKSYKNINIVFEIQLFVNLQIHPLSPNQQGPHSEGVLIEQTKRSN